MTTGTPIDYDDIEFFKHRAAPAGTTPRDPELKARVTALEAGGSGSGGGVSAAMLAALQAQVDANDAVDAAQAALLANKEDAGVAETLDIDLQAQITEGLKNIFDRSQDMYEEGVSSSNTAAQNTAALNDVLASHDALIIPEGVEYNLDNLDMSQGDYLIDMQNKNSGFGEVMFTPGSQASHVSLMSKKDDGIAALYIQPRGWTTSSQPAALKIFTEPYDTNLEDGGEDASTYRDFGFTINNKDGHNGSGSAQINVQGGGHLAPWGPDIHIGFKNNRYKPQRFLWAQPDPLPAGNFFAGGLADFVPGQIAWREGLNVSPGDLLTQGTGRVYEVQTAGVTGAARPIHSSYTLWLATVSDTSLYQAGEYVETGTGGTFPRGIVHQIKSTTELLISNPNTVLSGSNFTVGDTLTGQISGHSSILSATGFEVVDYDFDPTGGAFQQFNAPASSGRIVSDGGVDLMFLDDVTGGNADNQPFYPLTVFGDENSQPLYYDSICRFQFHDYSVLFKNAPIKIDGGGIDVKNSQMCVEDGDLKLNDSAITMTSVAHNWDVTTDVTSGNEVTEYGVGGPIITTSRTLNSRLYTGIAQSYSPVSFNDVSDQTPDVTGVSFAKFNHASATSILGFSGGQIGQIVHCRFNNGNTTFVESASLELNGSGNITKTAKTGCTFIKSSSNAWTLC